LSRNARAGVKPRAHGLHDGAFRARDPSTMPASIYVRGGLRVGWLHAGWPLARLVASERSLSVSARLLGSYEFTPDQVVALEPHGGVPVVGRGIRVVHSRPDYPRHIVFWWSGHPEKLIARIQREAGFLPRSTIAAAPASRDGAPVRRRAIVAAAATWLALGLLGGLARREGAPPPGPFPFLLLGAIFLGAFALRRSTAVQTWVLKPDRAIGEIKAAVSLVQLLSGFLLLVLGAALVVARLTSD
jgi:hypothetical protein